jgi:hypothetical protein
LQILQTLHLQQILTWGCNFGPNVNGLCWFKLGCSGQDLHGLPRF